MASRARWLASIGNTPAPSPCTTAWRPGLASPPTSPRTAASRSTSMASSDTIPSWTARHRSMGIRTGEALLQSLRDGRQLFIDGERVGDVTADPRFAAAAQSLADLYDMQH